MKSDYYQYLREREKKIKRGMNYIDVANKAWKEVYEHKIYNFDYGNKL